MSHSDKSSHLEEQENQESQMEADGAKMGFTTKSDEASLWARLKHFTSGDTWSWSRGKKDD